MIEINKVTKRDRFLTKALTISCLIFACLLIEIRDMSPQGSFWFWTGLVGWALIGIFWGNEFEVSSTLKIPADSLLGSRLEKAIKKVKEGEELAKKAIELAERSNTYGFRGDSKCVRIHK